MSLLLGSGGPKLVPAARRCGRCRAGRGRPRRDSFFTGLRGGCGDAWFFHNRRAGSESDREGRHDWSEKDKFFHM